jgi:sodium transport system permease protein
MKTIGVILKKELKKYFTDIRMVIGMILPGLIIFIIYTFMGEFMSEGIHGEFNKLNIYIDNEPQELSSVFEGLEYDIYINGNNLSMEEIIEKIESKEIDLYVIYPEGFYESIIFTQRIVKKEIPNVEMYYNSSSESSSFIYQYYSNFLMEFETSISNVFNINMGDIKYDLADEGDLTVMLFSMLLPFLLMTVLFSVSVSICTESISGEKERGTIATLLVTPAKRSHIAIGKMIALGITTLVSAFFTFIGLTASFPKLVGGNVSLVSYNVTTVFMLLLIISLTVLFFTVCLTIISTIAKTTKEASSYSVPLMMVVMLVGVTSFMGLPSNPNPLLFLIPIYNSVLGLTGVFALKLTFLQCLIFTLSNIVYISLGIFLLTKMFVSEKIMFNA